MMTNGYMDKILFVDLVTDKMTGEKPPADLYRKYIGGYGVGARILYDRMKPGIDALGPDNILGFVAGPLTGTEAQIGSRYTVVCKSPLTHTWGDANSGGFFGPKLKQSGFDAIFFEGISDRPVYLVIKDGKAELKDASHLWGLDTFEVEDRLKKEYGPKAEVASIGPAGEKLSLISGIVCSKGRLAARSGVGAVMGSKKLKAIVALGDMVVPVADARAVRDLTRDWIKSQSVFAGLYLSAGTPGLVEGSAVSGDLPTRNWHSAVEVEGLKLANFSAPAVIEHQARKWGCWKCSLACGGSMQGVYGGGERGYSHSHKPEYETIAALGPMCNNDDLGSIIKGSDLCNAYGLDTMSAGSTIAFAMDLYERGIVTEQDTSMPLKWGDADAILKLLKMMGERQGFGDVLADGVKVAAEKIGRGAARFAYHVQGQELPMHDPKYYPGFAIGYHIDDTPGRHMHNNAWAVICPPDWLSGIGVEGADITAYKGQGTNYMVLSAMSHFVNAAGACQFGWWSNNADFFYRFMTAVTDWPFDKEEARKAGERIASMRHAFNLREGHNPRKWVYPGIMVGDPPIGKGPLGQVTVDIDTLEREWLRAYHWDEETTVPDAKHLEELGIGELAAQMG
jgi:aldehyde:ferredoxin oxidoreductase